MAQPSASLELERKRIHELIPGCTVRIMREKAPWTEGDLVQVFDHRTARDSEEMAVVEKAVDGFKKFGSQEDAGVRPPHTIGMAEATATARFTDREESGPYPNKF